MEALFSLFLKEKQLLSNISPKTIRSYQQAFNCYVRFGGLKPGKPLGVQPQEHRPTAKAKESMLTIMVFRKVAQLVDLLSCIAYATKLVG